MVVVGLIGLPGAGKSQVAAELCTAYGFQSILVRPASKLETDFDALTIDDPSNVDHLFPSLEVAADFAMTNWRSNYVLLGLEGTNETIELFCKRPIFILAQIVAPLHKRFERTCRPDDDDLSTFVQKDDHMSSSPALFKLQEICKIILSNDGTLEELRAAVRKLELHNNKWIRPNWDTYFMTMADLASQRSNCMKRRVGAVIVQDCRVVATGYNGTPRNLKNCLEGGCPRCNQNAKCGLGLDFCICMHAEENALLEVGAARASGATIYTTSTPCLGCTKKIIQVGIKRVVFGIEYSIDHNSKDLFDAAGIILEKHQPALRKYYSCKELAN